MKNKVCLTFFSFIVAFFLLPSMSYASEEEGQDILFLIDSSYSMVTNDPHKTVYQALQTMGAISVESNNRIGYVLYNDSIIQDSNLVSINDLGIIDDWVNQFQGITPFKGTDVGLGLKTAQRILEVSEARENHTMIIWLSDGDTEYDVTNPNRSQPNVDQDAQEALAAIDYPIYTIQYSEVEVRDKSPMKDWAAESGGKNYSVQNAAGLQDAITDLYSVQANLSAERDSLASETQDNETFTLTIPVPTSETQQVKEMLITMNSPGTISNILYDEGEELSIERSGNQVVVRLNNPKQENYTISYQTETNEPVTTTTLTEMEDIPEEEPVGLYVLIGLGSIVVIAVGGIIMWTLLKKKKTEDYVKVQDYYFVDALEGFFTKTPNDEELPIQNWPATIFQKQKTISLYELLQDTTIQEQMPDAKKVQFQVGKENSLKMRIKGSIKGIQQGRDIPKGVWINLSIQKGAYLIFDEDELEMEFHIRKKRA